MNTSQRQETPWNLKRSLTLALSPPKEKNGFRDPTLSPVAKAEKEDLATGKRESASHLMEDSKGENVASYYSMVEFVYDYF